MVMGEEEKVRSPQHIVEWHAPQNGGIKIFYNCWKKV